MHIYFLKFRFGFLADRIRQIENAKDQENLYDVFNYC